MKRRPIAPFQPVIAIAVHLRIILVMNPKEQPSSFDELAAIYDLLIDWPKRLANEGPFFRRVFEEVDAGRVLDAACGTGRHAAMFHGWGLQVEGADVSPGMIAECRARWGEPPGLRWVVRPFDRAPDVAEPFDVVLCLGNSLALAGDISAVERSVAAMMDALRPGGACIIQVLNLWSLPESTIIRQKCIRVNHAGTDHVLLKSLRRQGGHGYIDLADLVLTDGGVTGRFDVPDFLGIEAEDLTRMAQSNGAADVRLFGSYQQKPYDRSTSMDLIAVCRSG